jgi:hypothetical protein
MAQNSRAEQARGPGPEEWEPKALAQGEVVLKTPPFPVSLLVGTRNRHDKHTVHIRRWSQRKNLDPIAGRMELASQDVKSTILALLAIPRKDRSCYN